MFDKDDMKYIIVNGFPRGDGGDSGDSDDDSDGNDSHVNEV